MPAKSDKQRRFMGAELSRTRAGKKTRTGMGESQLEDFAEKRDLEEKTHLETYPNPGQSQDEGAFSSANVKTITSAKEPEEKQVDPNAGWWDRGKLTGNGDSAGTKPSGGYKADSDWKAPVGTDQRLTTKQVSAEAIEAVKKEEREAKANLQEDIETLTERIDNPLEKMINLLDELHSTRIMKESLEELDTVIHDLQKHYGEGHEIPFTPNQDKVIESAVNAIEKYIGKDFPKLGSGREAKVDKRRKGYQSMKVSGRGLKQQAHERGMKHLETRAVTPSP